MIRTLLLRLMTLVGQTGTAEELEQGRLYEGGTEVTSESLGIRFVIPSGWQGGWPPGSKLFILESAEFGARILLYIDEGTFSEMRAQATSPIQLDRQTTLTPTGALAEKNGILHPQYTVSQPNVAASILGREVRPDLLITATTLAQSAQFAQVETFARQLIEGFSATAPPAQQASGAFGAKAQGSWHTQGAPRRVGRYCWHTEQAARPISTLATLRKVTAGLHGPRRRIDPHLISFGSEPGLC